MKKSLVILAAFVLQACNAQGAYVPRDGDIVFQVSLSSQSKAIQAATHSKYSHMGIVFLNGGTAYVYEAIGPVKETPLEKWVSRGAKNHFVVKRLRNADLRLTKNEVDKMKEVGNAYRGLPYDLTFEWSDKRIYCSELVWKIYKRALDLEIGHLQRIRDLDLTSPAVRSKIEERWGKNVPLDETVISPAAMYESDELNTVYEQ